MIYRSDTFEIDTTSGELVRSGLVVPLEPQTYRLLMLMLENHGRLVSKDEIVEKIWQGRAIADAALATCIKQVRTAVGDNGRDQKYIKTYSKRGFRFVGPVTHDDSEPQTHAASPPEAANPLDENFKFRADRSPSIAILPFRATGDGADCAGVSLGDALAHELIAEIARTNWLFVVARDSTFQFRDKRVELGAVRRSLDAKYCMTGEITSSKKQLRIYVELAHTESGGVVWANLYETPLDQIHEVRAEIAAHIHSSLQQRILSAETGKAKLKAPENLDAWSLYHLGLDRMFRFTEADAVVASRHFAKAIEREPSFARAHAGLSSAHYLCAQLAQEDGNGQNLRLARAAAEKAVELDPLDPYANFAMCGPNHMEGDIEEAITWTERAITINPNYSHAITGRGWLGVVCGHGGKEQELADLAMKLSPVDPLYYGMQVMRVMSHIVRDQFDEAAVWVEKAVAATSQPSPFLGIVVIMSHELANNRDEARRQASLFKEQNPGLNQAVFFQAFPFRSEKHKAVISKALSKHGL